MDKIDPDKQAICVVGIRREESTNRENFPEYIPISEKHGDRELWAPLVRLTEKDRNILIRRAGFDVLPHRSMECFPCFCSNRIDLRMLTMERVKHIAKIEKEMGFTKKGKPRVMFRPYRHQGATGIKEVWRWALSERGKYNSSDEVVSFCDSGYCGV
jgi:3'-phosphoadenosine 5'-phosphosulfate sulfotransferase (PAPS reductase)/FAD synthetase